MNQPFREPAFLQAVDDMTISFALLDAMLSHVFNTMEGNADMKRIAVMGYREKVDWFIQFVKVEFAELGSVNFHRQPVGQAEERPNRSGGTPEQFEP